MFRSLLAAMILVISSTAYAASTLEIIKIDENVYALVGELTQRSASNYGNNSTHGVIVTEEGVILIDSGGSYFGARQIHETIQTITEQPVKIVINTGGQDHRWFGNEYFKQLGARTIASQKAREDQLARTDSQIVRLRSLIGDSYKNTNPTPAEETFEQKTEVNLGGIKLELNYFGPAHTNGDITVWLASKRIMFTGDIVYNDRMLGIGPAQNFRSWISVFEKMAAYNPVQIIPGHGKPSDLTDATLNTYNYLTFLRDSVSEVLENDGDMQDALAIDQSAFSYLENFETIAGRNVQSVYEQMEFDF